MKERKGKCRETRKETNETERGSLIQWGGYKEGRGGERREKMAQRK